MARSNRVLQLALAAALFAGSAGVVLAQDAAGAIAARQAAMKSIGGAGRGLRSPTATAQTLNAAGQTINDNLKTFAANLPAGSGPDSGQKTKAKAEIWSDQPGFQAALDNALAASMTLAKASDYDSAKAAVKGVNDACGGCHTKYRAT